jgi:nicotinamide mononucleotide transporter
MSYLEFIGTILNLWSVWLVMRNSIWTWPVGNVAVILFGFLFYQIQLYSDLVEQVYFLITGFYGWWAWFHFRHFNKTTGKKELPVTYSSQRGNIVCLIIVVVGTVAMGYTMGHIHLYFPKLFSEAASFPYLDAFTTVMSFAANLLMAHKKIQCWYLWIAIDIIGIGLYLIKGVVFVAFLYVIFLILASKGLSNWRKIYKQKLVTA